MQILGIKDPTVWAMLPSDVTTSYLAYNPAMLSPSVIAALSADDFPLLPGIVFQDMLQSAVEGLTDLQLGALLPQQVSYFSADQIFWTGSNIKKLSVQTIQSLTVAQLQRMTSINSNTAKMLETARPVVWMSQLEISLLSPSTVNKLSSSSFKTLNTTQLAGLSREALINLTPTKWWEASDAERAAAVSVHNVKPAGVLNSTEIKSVSPAYISAILPESAEFLGVGFYNELDKSQFEALAPALIEKIPPSVFAMLNNKLFKYFTSTQLQNVKAEQALACSTITATFLQTAANAIAVSLATEVREAIDLAAKTSKLRTAADLQAAKAFRAYYVLTTITRAELTFADMWKSGFIRPASDKLLTNIKTLDAFDKSQKKSEAQRNRLQNGRMAGSASALAATAISFMYAQQSEKPEDKGYYIIQGFAQLTSLLQVPINEWAKLGGFSPGDALSLVFDEQTLAQRNSTAANAKWEAEGTPLNLKLKIKAANRLARADTRAESFKFFEKVKANVAEATRLNSPELAYDNLTEDEIHAKSEATLALEKSNQTFMGKESKAKWTKVNDGSFKRAFKISGIFQVANLFGTASAAWGVERAFNKSSKASDGEKISSVIGLASMLAISFGDAASLFLKDSKYTNLRSASMATRWGAMGLGPGLFLASVALVAMSLVAPFEAYKRDSGKANSIFLGVSVMNAFIQVGMMLAMALITVGGPVGVLIGAVTMLITLLLPSGEALAAQQKLFEQQKALRDAGRSTLANVVIQSYIKTITLDITPLTAIAHNFYAADHYAAMQKDMRKFGLRDALKEEAEIYARSSSGIDQISAIIKLLDTKEANAPKSYLSNVRSIYRSWVDTKEFYTTDVTTKYQYATLIGVSKEAGLQSRYIGSQVVTKAKWDSDTTDLVYDLDDQESAAVNSAALIRIAAATDTDAKLIIKSNNVIQSVSYSIEANYVEITGSAYISSTYALTPELSSSVIINGGTNGKDFAYFVATLTKDAFTILLDNFTNVVVSGAMMNSKTKVQGSKSDQSYMTNGSIDDVVMSGGHANLVLDGRGNKAVLSGGNNRVAVQLGVRRMFNQWNAQTSAGNYDGGASIAPTTVVSNVTDANGVQKKYTFDGNNTIDFSGSLSGLIFKNLSTGSTATTKPPVGSTEVPDIAEYKNFSTTVGSMYGDSISISGVNTPNKFILGMGFNQVLCESVKELTLNTMINSGVNPNDIKLYKSDVQVSGGEGSNNNITVSDSKVVAVLQGTDNINIDDSVNNAVEVWVGVGNHKIDIQKGSLTVNIYPVDYYQHIKSSVAETTLTDAKLGAVSSETRITALDSTSDVFITLGGTSSEMYVEYKNGEFIFSNSINKEVVYFDVSHDDDGDGNFYENDGFIRAGDGIGVAVSTLVDVMNSMASSTSASTNSTSVSNNSVIGRYTIAELFDNAPAPAANR